MTITLRNSSLAWKQLLTALVLTLMLVIFGYSSTTASTNGYFGPSIATLETRSKAAKKNVGVARSQLRKVQKVQRRLERQVTRDERRLRSKKLSASRRTKIESRNKKNKSALRSAQRTTKSAKRAYDKAVRTQETAKRRFEAAGRRAAEAKKRKAVRQAERAAAPANESSALAFAGGLFSRSASTPADINDYGARRDGRFRVAAVPVNKMDKRLLRQQVRYRTRHKTGTIVVDPRRKYLYLVQSGGTAMRYGIGVGKAGFEWSGAAHVGWKQAWPKWTPPEEMIDRRPDLRKWSAKNGGMPGGPSNPLGARALYLMQGGVDTLYRLHGTPEWKSIGTAASSGCIRLMNQDIIDLYKRVPQGAKVVVL